ncbi:MAG: Coenzyme F420 hydrogenase/dehydrogenase, beta subunit C-terminal domain [Deltaproteobacteria bacterium]|nr:Coenzyme F420 hydrogenase/dehydrogenase, beta subunit C-terminal domain [Candidatus Zymogenaceae bacterium]
MSNAQGPQRLLTEVLDTDLCCGCGACVGLCPYFTSFLGRTINLDPCDKEEGRCFLFCPRTELDLDGLSQKLFGVPYGTDAIGTHRDIYSSRAARSGKYQAGGTVTSLIEFLFDEEMIDAAALTTNDKVLPVADLVTDKAGVKRASGSKYSVAPTLSALNRAAREGYTRVAVVGTPCQVTAAAKMTTRDGVERNPGDAVAYVVGLFCTWGLDYRRLFEYLSGRVDIADITGFDIPPPPAELFVVETKQGKLTFPLAEIRPFVRESCRHCIDMTSEFADISVGVLEDNPAENLLIVRTQKGEELVKRAVDKGAIIVEKMPDGGLVHLKESALIKKKRALANLSEKDPQAAWGYIVGPGDRLKKIMD